jgi:hypothetical protein
VSSAGATIEGETINGGMETTVANMIQALAGFNAAGTANQGALFEPASSGLLHAEAGTLVGAHRVTASL